jgi:hypothetical protein
MVAEWEVGTSIPAHWPLGERIRHFSAFMTSRRDGIFAANTLVVTHLSPRYQVDQSEITGLAR